MQELLIGFINNVFQLINLDFFSYAFMAVVGLASVIIIRSVIWGH